MMQFDFYRIPGGAIVGVDATASKGAARIDYQLAGGAIVQVDLVMAANACGFCHEPINAKICPHCGWRN